VRIAVVALILASCGPAARPAAPAPPRAPARPVTRELVADLVAARTPWRDLIDPTIGLTWVQYTSMDSDPPVATSSIHLCGDAAIGALEARRSSFESAIEADEIFECATTPGPPTCSLGIAGEFAGTTRLIFTPDGRRLDAVEDVNSSYAPQDEAAVLARLRAQQQRARCE
jgi:hypothetical protein